MSTFASSQGQFNQYHFTIVEVDLPVVEGTCTISGVDGYGTPLSCDQTSNATKTYKFTNVDAPILPESGVIRCIRSISETPQVLQSGRGLASRGTASIQMIDLVGIDPNPNAPAVTAEVKAQGTYFGKLSARNIFANREVRIKNYRIESDGSIDLANGAETRYYLADSLNGQSGGNWTLSLKDELSRINIDDSVWPLPLEGSIRTAVNSTTTSIPVDANVTYVIGDTIRCGDEFMKVTGVAGIGTGAAVLTVNTRGAAITYTNTLTKTIADSHDVGDEVYVCEVSDNERLDDLLERILLDIGIDASLIPKADWTAEVDEWHTSTRVNTLWYESEDTAKVLERILTKYMIDMWFDPVAREVKLSAISVWKASSTTISEGAEIDVDSIKRKEEENLRATRALIVYDKPFLATSDSVENYRKASIFKRTDYEVSDLYGQPKTKRFGFSSIIDKTAADLLVQRWVSRYSSPFSFTWTTQEKKLNFSVGDVVDVKSSITVDFNGLPNNVSRCQITSIKPKYSSQGREYMISALSYEPAFLNNSEVVISGNVTDIDLYNQYAGAPSQAVTITFVFDAVKSSSSTGAPAIRAGAFPAGSKIIIILANAADLQAKGGSGGLGQSGLWDGTTSTWTTSGPINGAAGSIVYNAEGVNTDIYFSGATPSANYPTADGKIFAPSGGDGGFNGVFPAGSSSGASGGNGGNGGDGRSGGRGGTGGGVEGASGTIGTSGTTGSEFGVSGWGIPGVANDASAGGLAGSGVVDNGATVVFFGNTAANYINGNGDH